MGEEHSDSPELEFQSFPQETWSISNEGALDRPVSTHTHVQIANRTSYDNRSVKQPSAMNADLKAKGFMQRLNGQNHRLLNNIWIWL